MTPVDHDDAVGGLPLQGHQQGPQVDAGPAGRAPENARTVYEESDVFPQRVDLG